jgi:transcriptional regulator with XRE-family HTH domain
MSQMDAYKDELETLLAFFGRNVRRARLAMRLPYSQERLAEATHLHRTAVGRIEQGLTEPRLSTLLILADGLNVGVDELLEGLWVPAERRPSPTGDGLTQR